MPETGAGTGAGKKPRKPSIGVITKNAEKLDRIRDLVKQKDGWTIDNNQIVERALDNFLAEMTKKAPQAPQ